MSDPVSNRAGLQRVILVHGLTRSGVSMWPMARGLRRRGFACRTVSLWNLGVSVARLGERLFARVDAIREAELAAEGEEPVLHFVTHSLGGIAVRSMLEHHDLPRLGRVVMLGPPNRGSRLAEHVHDRVLHFPWGRFDPVRTLLPGERGDCAGAGIPPTEVGIIAGTPRRALGFPWSLGGLGIGGPLAFAPGLAGRHDGKVAVDETRLDGVPEPLELPYGHSFLMAWPEVIDQCAHFLVNGCFTGGDRPGPGGSPPQR